MNQWSYINKGWSFKWYVKLNDLRAYLRNLKNNKRLEGDLKKYMSGDGKKYGMSTLLVISRGL